MTSDNTIVSKYPLKQIYFYLTESCNLRCRHCWISPKYQGTGYANDALPLSIFENILDEALPLGLQTIKLTGGEPLLHPDIEALLSAVHKRDLRLIMETNGVLCTPSIAKAISACQSPFVSVSLDGAEAETHEWVRGVKGCFEAALAGLRNLVTEGLAPQIIMSLMKRNRHQIEDIIRLAERLGAGSVRFNPVQPMERGSALHHSGEAMTVDEFIELGEWVSEELGAQTNIRLLYNQPMAFKPMSRMFGDKGTGCETCGIRGIIGVLADGSYALCGIGTSVPEMVFGEAGKDELKAVWENNETLNRIRSDLPERLEGICGQCIMKGVCLGRCIAQNFYTSRTLWAPFWYCEEAHAAGLFPTTRLSRP